MAPRKCCCNVGCDIASDDFNRADSTSVGSDWDEESGDWAIASNKLTVPTAGVIRNVAVNPYGSNSMYISAKIENLADDTKYRILLQMNATGTEYYFAEWHYVDATTMYFRLGDETGVLESTGPDDPTGISQINASMTVKNQLCMSDLSSRITVCVEPKPASTHKYGGLAAGNSNGAAFDDYAAFATTAESVDCQGCDCTCQGWCIPDALIATFQDVNECPALDGFTIDLDNGSIIKFGSGWLGSDYCPDLSGLIDLKYECANDELGTLTYSAPAAGGPAIINPDPEVSTCHPLSLRFGPINFGTVSDCGTTECCGGNPCGTTIDDTSLVYIWITKRLTDYDY